jgi:hypothetical protein
MTQTLQRQTFTDRLYDIIDIKIIVFKSFGNEKSDPCGRNAFSDQGRCTRLTPLPEQGVVRGWSRSGEHLSITREV